MILLLTILTVSSVAITHVRCLDAARAGARSAARGESTSEVERVAGLTAPARARVSVLATRQTVTVRVEARVSAPWGLGLAAGFEVSGEATAQRETPS